MFPESHSHAFAISAYQAAWIKCYFPLEFYISLMNNQPMGFYPNEAIKQDARRFGINFVNPCINKSILDCSAHAGTLLIGLRFVKNIGNSGSNKNLFGNPSDSTGVLGSGGKLPGSRAMRIESRKGILSRKSSVNKNSFYK